jgi:tetratricopeptide (TPR) repeat protein
VSTPDSLHQQAQQLLRRYRADKDQVALVEALTLCRAVWREYPTNLIYNRTYAWVIYESAIRGMSNPELLGDPGTFFRAVYAILDLCSQVDKKSPYERVVFRVLAFYRAVHPYPTETILSWTDRLDPNQLMITNREDYYSPRETWCAHRSKALFKAGRYAETLQICQDALNLPLLKGRLWFEYRKGMSHFQLGDYAHSLTTLQWVFQRFPKPFLEGQLALIHAELNQPKAAFLRAISAARAEPNVALLGRVYLLLARLYEHAGQLALAREHILFVCLLRSEYGWGISSALTDQARRLGVTFDRKRSLTQVYQSLRQHWEHAATPHQMTGHILQWQPKTGVIRGLDGTDYPIHLGAETQGIGWKVGMSVQFESELLIDPTTGTLIAHARFIRPDQAAESGGA